MNTLLNSKHFLLPLLFSIFATSLLAIKEDKRLYLQFDGHDPTIDASNLGVAGNYTDSTDNNDRSSSRCRANSHSTNPLPPRSSSKDSDFDYIVVGGGSAGIVIATRIADSLPNLRILMIESGANLIDDPEVMSETMKEIFKAPYCVPGQTADKCPLLSLPLHFSDTPFMTPYPSVTNHSYYYTTTPQIYGSKREIVYPRGNVLGGSSATNNMVAFRGHPDDYDHWRDDLGLEGWGYNDLLPYMRRIETNHDYYDLNSTVHGNDGPIHLKNSSSFFRFPVLDGLLEAAWKMGYPKVVDFNKGYDHYGAGYWQQYSNENGRRTSSYEYLRRMIRAGKVCMNGEIAETLNRNPSDKSTKTNKESHRQCTAQQNLHVITDALVTKLLFEKGSGSTKPRAIGLEYVNHTEHRYKALRHFPKDAAPEENENLKTRAGMRYWSKDQRSEVLNCPVDESLTFDEKRARDWDIPEPQDLNETISVSRIYVKREIVLAAGAINSPQLLMLSGVGPRDHLERLGFEPDSGEIIADLPGLGRILDHEEVTVNFKIPASAQHWGILKDLLGEAHKWVNDPTHSALSSNHVPGGLDVSSEGVNGTKPSIHIHFLMIYFENLDATHWRNQDARHRVPGGMTDFTMWQGLQHYTTLIERSSTCSVGKLQLRNRDPLVPPLLDPAYGSCLNNIDEIMFGIRLVRKLNAQLPKDIQGEEVLPGVEWQTDEQLRHWIRSMVWGHHISGTARMGRCDAGDEDAVLDGRGRVYGVEGIRVGDASVFPTIPHGNILYSTYIVAERIAEWIVQDHRNSTGAAERKSILNPGPAKSAATQE